MVFLVVNYYGKQQVQVHTTSMYQMKVRSQPNLTSVIDFTSFAPRTLNIVRGHSSRDLFFAKMVYYQRNKQWKESYLGNLVSFFIPRHVHLFSDVAA